MSSSRSTSSLVVTLAVSVACGPVIDDPTDDAGNDDGSSTASSTASTTDGPGSASEGSGVADSGTTTPGTTDEPVDCNVLSAEECMRFAACQTVRGTEATLERETGEYYCSDLAFPFACTPADCEAVPNVVICKLDEPGVAMWVLDDCIPAGWEPCPDAMCG